MFITLIIPTSKMKITDLPSEIILHIESYINDMALLEDLIFVNKYFRYVFIDRLNNNILNYNKNLCNSYTYYPSDIKEKIYQYEKNEYKRYYYENVINDDVVIGCIERHDISVYRGSTFFHPIIEEISYWKTSFYIPFYKLNNFYNKHLDTEEKMELFTTCTYSNGKETSKKQLVKCDNSSCLSNHLTYYFTKEMAINQVIYLYKQLSK